MNSKIVDDVHSVKKSKKLFLPILRKLGPSELKAELIRLQSELKVKSNLLIRAVESATPSYHTFTAVSSVENEGGEKIVDEEEDFRNDNGNEDDGTADVDAIPPDEILGQAMNVLFTKKLRNVSITNYYDICWSEGQRNLMQLPEKEHEEKCLYGPWLKSQGKEDVTVGRWEEGPFMEEISGEQFDKRRVVTFHFIKSFSVAYVTNTQYCRLEGDSRCVISMNVETDGVTFGDTFTVVIRWVATRVGRRDLQVQVGLHVNFKKSTIFESKIRMSVMENTMPQMADLFTVFKRACYKKLGYFDQSKEEKEGEGLIKESLEDSQNVEPAKSQNLSTSITNILLLLVIPCVLLIIWKQWQQRPDQQHILLSQVKDLKKTFEKVLHDIEKLKSEVENALQSVNKILIETNHE